MHSKRLRRHSGASRGRSHRRVFRRVRRGPSSFEKRVRSAAQKSWALNKCVNVGPLPLNSNGSGAGNSQLTAFRLLDCNSPYFIQQAVLSQVTGGGVSAPPVEVYIYKTKMTHMLRNCSSFPIYMDVYKIVARNSLPGPANTNTAVLSSITSSMRVGLTTAGTYTPYPDLGVGGITTSVEVEPFASAVMGYGFQKQYKILSHKVKVIAAGKCFRLVLNRRWSSTKPVDFTDEGSQVVWSIYKGNKFIMYRFWGTPNVAVSVGAVQGSSLLAPFAVAGHQITEASFRYNSDASPSRTFSSSLPSTVPGSLPWVDLSPSHMMSQPSVSSSINIYGNTPSAMQLQTDATANGLGSTSAQEIHTVTP